MEKKTYLKNQIVFHENDEPENIYFIEKGEFLVFSL